MVDVEYLIYDEDIEEVHEYDIENILKYTTSKRAEEIIEKWEKEKENFWKIIPGEYKKALKKWQEEETEKREKAMNN